MAQIQILTQFNRLLGEVKTSLDTYNEQVKNEMFEIDDSENLQQIYRKGERIFDQVEDDLINIDVILNKENEIMNFFAVCRENKMKLIDYKNEIINKMLRLKKNNSQTKDEYLNFREEWNKKRIESPDMKNRRECEEMLEDIKEEQKNVQEMRQKMKEEKEELKQMIEKIAVSKKVECCCGCTNEKNVKEYHNIKRENKKSKENKEFVNNDKNVDSNEKNIIIEEINNKIVEETNQLKEIQMNEMKQLEEWTGLSVGEILFDSEYDNWDVNSSVFDEKVNGKRQLVFLIEEEKGEKFGYYLNTTIKESMSVVETDTYSFEFNLCSNGRLQEPMKFEIKDIKKGGYLVWKKSSDILIQMGNIVLNKENKKTESYCIQNGRFNYHGVSKALCGKAGYAAKDAFIPKHISVIQMVSKE